MRLARIAIPVPLGRTFTYRVPDSLWESCQPGSRVVCEFGRRQVLGVVVDTSEGEPDLPPERLKSIDQLVDPEPVIPRELLDFLREMARYYLAPLGEVMRLALPAIERSTDPGRAVSVAKAKQVGKVVQVARWLADGNAESLRLSERSRALLSHLRDHGETPLAELVSTWGNARAMVKRLQEQGLVELLGVTRSVDPYLVEPTERTVPPVLTSAQSRAVTAVAALLERKERSSFLLHGVTASGKTEVYLHLVERCLALGRGALVLVPEIALTPQLVGRFRSRLECGVAVIHSDMSDLTRHAMWKRLRTGEFRVAIGARSALFAPVPELGLVCVDEEHDASFKQEEGVRYHARDMALLRAHRAQAVAVLGSATPSLASQHAVRNGNLTLLELPSRAHATSELPEVELIDLRQMGPGPSGDRLLTVPLVRALSQVLEGGEQAIVFLNRRGFAPALICEECGHIAQCPDCSVSLTVHRASSGQLLCHYCGYRMPLSSKCSACSSDRILEQGLGTERVQQALSTLFPGARIGRLDRDVAAGLKSEAILSRMRDRSLDILVGTQMVTKGHDLPEVTLVGVLDADASLSIPDFRASERTFQLLVQVAGRAGRAGKKGRVLIQTRQPEIPAIRYAVTHDVSGFVASELEARRELAYPPFSRLALVRCDGLDEASVTHAVARLASVARAAATQGVRILGPSAAPIARLRNRYRHRFLVKSASRPALRDTVLAVLRTSVDRRVHVVVDIDPVGML